MSSRSRSGADRLVDVLCNHQTTIRRYYAFAIQISACCFGICLSRQNHKVTIGDKTMTLKNVEVIEQEVHEKTWFQKFRAKASHLNVQTGLVLSGAGLGATTANAAEGTGIAASILELITAEITAVMNSQKAIYGLMIIVIIGFVVWRYSKRTVSSA